MKLNETIELMNSEDYKERFKGEYAQLVIRYCGLSAIMFLTFMSGTYIFIQAR